MGEMQGRVEILVLKGRVSSGSGREGGSGSGWRRCRGTEDDRILMDQQDGIHVCRLMLMSVAMLHVMLDT